MGTLSRELTEDEYARLNWFPLIEGSDWAHYRWSAAAPILERSRELQDAGDQVVSEALSVIAGAISMQHRHGGPSPFGEMIRTRDGRSLSMEDLGADDATLLARVARDTTDPWLRARFADLAISIDGGLRSDWVLGRLCVEAYFDYAASVLETEWAIDGVDEFRRGLILFWIYTKRDEALWSRIWELAIAAVQHAVAQGWPGVAFPLCDEAMARNKEVCAALAPIIQGRADAIAATAPLEAERLYDYASCMWHRLRQPDKSRAAMAAQGECFVAAATLAADSNPIMAPHWLMSGIAALRRARAPQGRIHELRDLLATHQLASLDHFHGQEFRIDVSDWVQLIEREMIGPTFLEALLQMAFRVERWLDFDSVRAHVLDTADRFIFSSMFASQHSNDEGAVVATQQPLDKNDEETIFQRMVAQSREVHLGMRGNVLVSLATSILYSNYQPPFSAIKEIVDASPFSPRGHTETLARGLYAGICDDWVGAAAYLIPSVEPLVRANLRSSGVHTTVHREDGTQQERTLSELLVMPEAERLFGKGLLLELRTLLTEPVGFNLRNAYCHGLLANDQLGNSGTMALWWCLWRMVLFAWSEHPAVAAPPVRELGCLDEDEDEDEPEPEADRPG